MSLQDEIYKKIKEEIANDPMGIGYALAKDDAEVQKLLNSEVRKTRTVEDVSPSPMNRILSGLKDAPNICDTKDVTDAKASIAG
jgi:hypothetical protein